MTREKIELLCRNIQASTGDWKPEESILLKHDAEQRQIVDEQVEENRGLRSDVKLMQQANAKQRQEIERLQAELARLKSELSHWSWVRFKQIEEENARLREALENSIEGEGLWTKNDMAREAMKALKEQS